MDYSQAQNTRAKFLLQPDWLQHVSNELQLQTHKHRNRHMSVLRERNAQLDQNILLNMQLGSRPGNFAQGKHLVLTHVKPKKTRCDDVSFWERNTCSTTSSPHFPLSFSPTSHFRFHTTRATFAHAHKRTLIHILPPQICQYPGSFPRTWLVRNVPAACRSMAHIHTCFHKSPLSQPLRNNRKKMCLSHILHTSGKPTTGLCKHQALSTTDLRVWLSISVTYVMDRNQRRGICYFSLLHVRYHINYSFKLVIGIFLMLISYIVCEIFESLCLLTFFCPVQWTSIFDEKFSNLFSLLM